MFDVMKALGATVTPLPRNAKIGIRPSTESEITPMHQKPRPEDSFYVTPKGEYLTDRRTVNHGYVTTGPATLEINSGPNLINIPLKLGERNEAILLALKLQQLSVKREEVAHFQGMATLVLTILGSALLILAGALGASNQPYRQP